MTHGSRAKADDKSMYENHCRGPSDYEDGTSGGIQDPSEGSKRATKIFAGTQTEEQRQVAGWRRPGPSLSEGTPSIYACLGVWMGLP